MRVLQDLMSQQQGRDLTFNPTVTPVLQGYLELRGLRSKLYTVVSADKVFLYKNQEVCVCVCVCVCVFTPLRPWTGL